MQKTSQYLTSTWGFLGYMSKILATFFRKYLRSIALFLLPVALVLLPATASAANKYASLIMEPETGRVLHSRNADSLRHPASLTKIMTLYMVFEALQDGRLTMDQRLKVSRRASRMPSSKLGLGRGETITVRQAVLALVTKSANDVAVVVAETLAGTEPAFADRMTKKARTLGMTRTTFKNASGLYHKHQKSTARDMARLAERVRSDFPQYYGLFETQSFTFRGRKYKNHNKLLSRYSGTDGIKTGYIGAAGFNLVSSVSRHGVRLVGVVFGGKSSRSRDRHMIDLLDKAFVGYEVLAIRPPRKPGLPTVPGTQIARGNTTAVQPNPNPFLAQVNTALDRPTNPKPPVRPAINQTPNGVWSIQVGAYRSKSRAHTAAQKAQSKLGPLSEHTVVAVVPARKSSRPLFRSRLAGLDKSAAYTACNVLKQQRVDCMVFAPQRGAQVAQRSQ